MRASDIQHPVARIPHRCTWCGDAIEAGSTYKTWKSFEDSVFTNKMHRECVDSMIEEYRETGCDEYTPFTNDRPTGSTGK